VQYVADWFDVSDNTALRAVRALEKRGLLSITNVYDPPNRCRRLMISRSRKRGVRIDPGPSRDKEEHRNEG
jgi:hypothetical protein